MAGLLLDLHYDAMLSPEAVFQAHAEFGRQFPDVPRPPLSPGPKIRIGYVSGDFCAHAVACFLLPLLSQHDRSRFEIFLYSKFSEIDVVTMAFKGLGQWREIDRDDDAALRQIRADKIDILVDCTGHTARKSMSLFARRPAPIAMTFLGYPDTTGLPQIDYRLTDAVADPEGSLAVEELIRLPHGVHSYKPFETTPVPKTDRSGPIVFAFFGRADKMNKAVKVLWQHILNAVPGATLALNPSHGLSQVDYYAAYNDIDIALDPFPYNGTTVTCDAFWMGVPIVALSGDRHCGRMGASLLTRVGLTDLIARTPQEYAEIAVRLANDRPRLAELRATLRDRMKASPLGDAKIVMRDIEAFYVEAIRRRVNA